MERYLTFSALSPLFVLLKQNAKWLESEKMHNSKGVNTLVLLSNWT